MQELKLTTNSTVLNETDEGFKITPLTDTQAILFTFMFSIAFFVGLIGNLIVIIVIVFKRELRHFTNYFFVNLSIADILVLIVCIPTVMQDIHFPDKWIYGQFLCKYEFSNVIVQLL